MRVTRTEDTGRPNRKPSPGPNRAAFFATVRPPSAEPTATAAETPEFHDEVGAWPDPCRPLGGPVALRHRLDQCRKRRPGVVGLRDAGGH
jgi:hypothetical protein